MSMLLSCKRVAFGIQLHCFCLLKAMSLQVDWSKVRMLKRWKAEQLTLVLCEKEMMLGAKSV